MVPIWVEESCGGYSRPTTLVPICRATWERTSQVPWIGEAMNNGAPEPLRSWITLRAFLGTRGKFNHEKASFLSLFLPTAESVTDSFPSILIKKK